MRNKNTRLYIRLAIRIMINNVHLRIQYYTRSYYRKESAASGLRNQKQPRSQAQEKAWERGWIKSTPKGSKAACTIC